MRVLGLGGLDHNGAAAVLDRGTIQVNLEAERVTREKNVGLIDERTIIALLDALDVRRVDVIAVADRSFWAERRGWLEPLLRRRFGATAPILTVLHHDCHLMAAMVASPWEEALCVSIDGKGDGTSTMAAVARREGLSSSLVRVPSAHSLGRLWWGVGEYCGLSGHHSAGKVMALAAYGEPLGLFEPHVKLLPGGAFELCPRQLHPDTFRQVPRIVAWLEEQLGTSAGTLHPGAASSIQRLTEVIVQHVVGAGVRASALRRVCLSGGVALNGLANQALIERGVVDELSVPPFTDDRGLAIGAAAVVSAQIGFPVLASAGSFNPYLGLPAAPVLPADGWAVRPLGLRRLVDRLLASEVVAVYRGCDEAGPRALGHRSILASPTPPGMRDHLNVSIKHREPFRPFGCAVKAEVASAWFDLDGPSPYMLRIAQVRQAKAALIPSALHVDGTTRIQTVTEQDGSGLWQILDLLEARGHPPVVINTSLNGSGEPIAHRPEEALAVADRLGIKAIYIEESLLERVS